MSQLQRSLHYLLHRTVPHEAEDSAQTENDEVQSNQSHHNRLGLVVASSRSKVQHCCLTRAAQHKQERRLRTPDRRKNFKPTVARLNRPCLEHGPSTLPVGARQGLSGATLAAQQAPLCNRTWTQSRRTASANRWSRRVSPAESTRTAPFLTSTAGEHTEHDCHKRRVLVTGMEENEVACITIVDRHASVSTTGILMSMSTASCCCVVLMLMRRAALCSANRSASVT